MIIDPRKKSQGFDIVLSLMGRIPLILGTDKVDVVAIHDLTNIFLKHNIFRDGIVLYEVPGVRLDVELAIIGEYRDFCILERQYYKD